MFLGEIAVIRKSPRTFEHGERPLGMQTCQSWNLISCVLTADTAARARRWQAVRHPELFFVLFPGARRLLSSGRARYFRIVAGTP
jgi:hypothetical protein